MSTSHNTRPFQPFGDRGRSPKPRLSPKTRATTLFAITLGTIVAIAWWVVTHAQPNFSDGIGQTDRPPPAHVAFLLDLTDPLGPAQAQQIANRIRHERDHLPVGGRLTVFALHPQVGDTVPLQTLFSSCKPSDGHGTSRLTGNPELDAAKYREGFLEPSEAALKKLQERWQATPESPLIEALHWLAEDGPGFDSAVPNRTLILISDLLQNSTFSSRFRKGTRFAAMVKTNSAYLTRDALAGVHVEIVQVVNQHQWRQTADLRAFWQDYFRYAGVVNLDEVKQL